MTELIDSHCHLDRLDLSGFDHSLEKALEASRSLGVTRMICVSVEMETFPEVHALALKYPQVYASVGKHPTDHEGEEPSVERLIDCAAMPKVVAVGETGLDYYHDAGNKCLQRERFIRHISAAKEVNKPLIIHTRDAREDTLAILKEENVSQAVFHCFTDTWEMAKAGPDLGLYISFSGIITFKNAQNLREVVKKVPLERLLVETDAPYLTPVPHRGKANIPGYTRHVAECVATVKGISFEEAAEATCRNTCQLFNL